MTTEPKKPKASEPYIDKLGQPIPLDNFGNDIPVGRDIDKSPGSLYDDVGKQIDDAQAKAKPEKK